MSIDSFEASRKRSDEIRADLPIHPEKYTMLTGDRPTGRLHMGHYFGTIRERVALQDMGITTRIIIADYQVITDRDTTEHIQDNVYNMVVDYLACGIDPEKTIIFTHSAVPALNQLMLPFLSLVTESELLRNPTVKSEMDASGHALTGLLLTYPVHQACDILFCKGNIVPVGKDQLPHIEQTRQVARRFNERYGHVFPEPEGVLNDAVEIPGLDGRKMSKSYGNAISLSLTAEETAKLIKKSKTDADRMITYDKENRPGVSALLTTAALCTGRTEVDIAEEIGDGGSGTLKKYVTESVNEFLAPIRERRVQLADVYKRQQYGSQRLRGGAAYLRTRRHDGVDHRSAPHRPPLRPRVRRSAHVLQLQGHGQAHVGRAARPCGAAHRRVAPAVGRGRGRVLVQPPFVQARRGGAGQVRRHARGHHGADHSPRLRTQPPYP